MIILKNHLIGGFLDLKRIYNYLFFSFNIFSSISIFSLSLFNNASYNFSFFSAVSTHFSKGLKVENGGEPLIKATKDQVKNFLLNNFIEKDGHPLSAASIDTLLTPSKEDKRALKGDRIDTQKLKEKK